MNTSRTNKDVVHVRFDDADCVNSYSLLCRKPFTTNSISSQRRSMISPKRRSASSRPSDRWSDHSMTLALPPPLTTSLILMARR